MALHTLLGANGTIGTALLPILLDKGHKVRLVARRPMHVDGAETVTADVLNAGQLERAVAGSAFVYLLIGIQYDAKIWARDWPVIMRNVIDACKKANAKLVFFDNVYMYGRVDGRITEATPYKPVSKKGEVRAGVARMLQQEMQAGTIKAIIARAVDFYGPGVTDKSAAGVNVFSNMKKGKRAQWFVNADVPRALTYVPDAAEGIYKLATTDTAYGQVWHLPSAEPILSGRQLIKIAAKYMDADDKVTVLPKWLLKVLGWFIPFLGSMYEMLYQDEYPFEFDSSKYNKAFDTHATPYEKGIKETANWFKNDHKV